MGKGMRAKAHLPVHTGPELWFWSDHFALPPQKQGGLLGTGTVGGGGGGEGEETKE